METIEFLESLIASHKSIIDRLSDRIIKLKIRNMKRYDRRIPEGGMFYKIVFNKQGKAKVVNEVDLRSPTNDDHFNCGNYFSTDFQSYRVAEQINACLKLEILFNTYCPHFLCDWGDDEQEKFMVHFNYQSKNWEPCQSPQYNRIVGVTYFPSIEIATQVCIDLNSEKI